MQRWKICSAMKPSATKATTSNASLTRPRSWNSSSGMIAARSNSAGRAKIAVAMRVRCARAASM